MLSKTLKGIFLAFISITFICALVGCGVVAVYYNISAIAIITSFLGFGILFFLFYLLMKKSKLDARILLIIVLAVGAALRLVYVICANQPPMSDFKTYHDLAIMLSNGIAPKSSYVSMFPHVMGLPMFLAPFYWLFGPSELVAQIVNVGLDILTAWLLFLISWKLFHSRKGALITAFLFSMAPTVIFYCEIIGTEKLFTFLVVLLIYTVLHIQRKPVLFSLVAGFIAGITNAVRPCGLMLIIAIILFGIAAWKFSIGKKTVCLAVVIGTYLVMILANTQLVSAFNQTEVATKAAGWNLYVGANAESFGQWNQEDAELFEEKVSSGLSPNQIHSEFKDLAIERLKENGIFRNIVLWIGKFTVIWATDISVFSYLQQEQIHLNALQSFPLESLSTAFYLWAVILTWMGAYRIWKKDESSSLMVLLVILGSVGMHLFAEVMGRYGYTSIALFYIIASYGVICQERLGLND